MCVCVVCSEVVWYGWMCCGWIWCLWVCTICAGVFGVIYDGYLSNAEEDVEGAIPVIIKTVKGRHM